MKSEIRNPKLADGCKSRDLTVFRNEAILSFGIGKQYLKRSKP
jgi:hypothetical protein